MRGKVLIYAAKMGGILWTQILCFQPKYQQERKNQFRSIFIGQCGNSESDTKLWLEQMKILSISIGFQERFPFVL